MIAWLPRIVKGIFSSAAGLLPGGQPFSGKKICSPAQCAIAIWGGRTAKKGGVTHRKEDTMYRVLIVEDDLGIGDAVHSLAEKWGLQARCVKNFRDVME